MQRCGIGGEEFFKQRRATDVAAEGKLFESAEVLGQRAAAVHSGESAGAGTNYEG